MPEPMEELVTIASEHTNSQGSYESDLLPTEKNPGYHNDFWIPHTSQSINNKISDISCQSFAQKIECLFTFKCKSNPLSIMSLQSSIVVIPGHDMLLVEAYVIIEHSTISLKQRNLCLGDTPYSALLHYMYTSILWAGSIHKIPCTGSPNHLAHASIHQTAMHKHTDVNTDSISQCTNDYISSSFNFSIK